MEIPLPWERLLWAHRTWWPPGTRYFVTDLRVVAIERRRTEELAVQDIREVERLRSLEDRASGTSTIVLHPRRAHLPIVTLRRVPQGVQLAAMIELLAGEPRAVPDAAMFHAVLAWQPRVGGLTPRRIVAGIVAVAVLAFTAAIGLRGEAASVAYPDGDAIRPGGEKRDREAIVEFMETEVLPWAQATLGPLKGGPERVGCETCHGADPDARDWAMPSVAALPEPQIGLYGSEGTAGLVDSQMRNAMYGYLADASRQEKAAYMRQVVVPGVARLLGRPAYDFTRAYEYNRTRAAIGCYHCHQAEADRMASNFP